ncbi:peptidoglycan editing factor PgeF [Cohnella suwonensis]|uniref:Purine nucleoside phosphorylase n=1 Tax=Cohnella suwonensis TaxID=696072 RepID=A0ABW0LRI8_9BACL
MDPFRMNGRQTDGSLLMLQHWNERYGLTAGFTTRHAGNVALHVGDDPGAVIGRRSAIAESLGWTFEAFTCAEQVHGSDVRVIDRKGAGSGRMDRESACHHTDALVTNEDDVFLAMFYADCVPLYFYDPDTGAMGLAHAGWKGTVADIVGSTVSRMSDVYGANPANIVAAIGPSIGACCYEVDGTVLSQVMPLVADDPATAAIVVRSAERKGRAMLDLKHLNRHLMIKAGILPSGIEVSSWCTSCRNDLLFSHRKENGTTGRMMSWIGRKSR